LRDLQARGLPPPRLVIGDGHLGLWGALRGIYPEAQEQRCWNHRIVNVLDRVGRRDQPAARELLRQVAYAPTLPAAERNKRAFQAWCGQRGYRRRAFTGPGLERMVTFYRFPRNTGAICGPPTRWSLPLPPCGCARWRPNASRKWRTPRR